MSHVSLYRKYRPQTFDQVLGQDAIIQSLQSALQSGKISHAYLFAGSRGTGKTSIARIFARELGTSRSDIYEIDAASNNGVDEIRELRDGVSTLPFDSKYKVYILDEVHMLSKAAFNALLKTLEEPPAHVIFILATTELHKVLDTVKSRCQVFEFKKPTIEILSGLIKTVAGDEGFGIDNDAAELIAKRGDGAFRDTLGVLERVLQSAKSKTITSSDVENVMSAPHHELVDGFMTALIAKNLGDILQIINQVKDGGHNLDHFMESVIERCRLVLLFRFAPAFAESVAVELSDDARGQIKSGAAEKNIINAQLLAEMLGMIGEMKKTTMPEVVVELGMIQLLNENKNTPL